MISVCFLCEDPCNKLIYQIKKRYKSYSFSNNTDFSKFWIKFNQNYTETLIFYLNPKQKTNKQSNANIKIKKSLAQSYRWCPEYEFCQKSVVVLPLHADCCIFTLLGLMNNSTCKFKKINVLYWHIYIY